MATVPLPHQFAVGEDVTSVNINTYYSGISFLEQRPIFMGFQQNPQTGLLSNTNNPINMDTSIVDSYNGHSTTVNPSEYVAQVAGWYKLSGTAAVSDTTTTNNFVSGFLKNGVFIAPSAARAPASVSGLNRCWVIPTIYAYLNVNDYVQLYIYPVTLSGSSTAAGSGIYSIFVVEWSHT